MKMVETEHYDNNRDVKNLVNKPRNEISKELVNRLQMKVRLSIVRRIKHQYILFKADAIRRRSEEAKRMRKEEVAHKLEQSEQARAEKEVMERVNKRGVDVNGATIDWDVVQI